MWCPNCQEEYGAGTVICPFCGATLKDAPPETAVKMEPEFLMYLVDRAQLEQAEALLMQARIPHQWQDARDEAGQETEEDGAALYVDRRYTHRAMRLLRPLDQRAAFSEAELEAAMDAYGPVETENETGGEAPVSPEGYRMVWVFLAVFGLILLLGLIPLIARLL
ncbi:MAG: zinc ribbon domain-containing protein [Oscillospiraceae bacterium]|nr:zinc ribbon domain-containing protein [Oscillospiraceae bacterium]